MDFTTLTLRSIRMDWNDAHEYRPFGIPGNLRNAIRSSFCQRLFPVCEFPFSSYLLSFLRWVSTAFAYTEMLCECNDNTQKSRCDESVWSWLLAFAFPCDSSRAWHISQSRSSIENIEKSKVNLFSSIAVCVFRRWRRKNRNFIRIVFDFIFKTTEDGFSWSNIIFTMLSTIWQQCNEFVQSTNDCSAFASMECNSRDVQSINVRTRR